eukprot:97883_1
MTTTVASTQFENYTLVGIVVMAMYGLLLIALLVEMLRRQRLARNNMQYNIHSNEAKDYIKAETILMDYDSVSDGHYLQALNPINTLQHKLSYEARDLCENDTLHVEAIYNYIKHIVLTKSIPINFFCFEKISDVMIRCHKLIIMNGNKQFEIRFNIFLKDAQTFIHDHQANFISLCISGGFVHDIFEINSCTGSAYHKYERIDADTVKYCGSQGGKIQHINRSIHQRHKMYFLDRDVLHTVCTPESILYNELKCISSCHDINLDTKNDIMKQDVITFVVRSKLKKKINTTIVSNDFVDPKSTINAGGKTDLSHDEQIKIIKLLHNSMKR